jgi:transketolase
VYKRLDRDIIIKAAKETGAIVTAEEHSIIGGLGSAVLEVLSDECPVPLKRVGVNDTFGESGKPNELLEKYGLTDENIKKCCLEVIKIKNK